MKYALITGAAGGMGSCAATQLQQQGYTVFALDKAPGESTDTLIWLQADVTDEDSLLQALQQVKDRTDRLDAIVHFAGMYMLDSLVEMDTAAFDRIFSVNLRGAFLINKLFLPLLQPGSRILMVTSELAPLDPLPFTGIYAVTKSALDKYAYSLAMELQMLGVRVSVLRAGAVRTGMLGVSTDALNRFCEKTEIYTCNATRFKTIVGRVEARHILPEKLAGKACRILKKKSPRFAYRINANPLLLLLNALPKRFQLWIIKKILQ